MQFNDRKLKPPLSQYKPFRTGWRRNSELDPAEQEQRGITGLVIVALIFMAMALFWWRFSD
jgi:hypothetical protein